MFYSEHVFWAHVRPEDTLLGYIETWLLYSLLAFVFLAIIGHFRVRTIWALFLAGAVFGWLTEGVIVQTTYDSLPLSISFTALSWHALLSVWIGWYAVRKAIQTSIGSTLKMAVIIGIFYGLWAIAWWSEPDQTIATPTEFALYTEITTLLLIASYWLFDRNITDFQVGRRTKIIAAVLLLVYFGVVTIPAAPIAIIVLPMLLLIAYGALRRNAQHENQPSLLADTTPARFKNYLALLAMPLTALVIYTFAYSQQFEWHVNRLVYLVTMPLGFLLLAVSLVKVWRNELRMLKGVSNEIS